MKYIRILIIIFLITIIPNVYAYTKEDIISLASSIKTCSSKTQALVNGTKASYTRLLNERDVSESDLNKIYNNMKYVVNRINEYSVCSVEDKNKIPNYLKNELYSLYNETSNIILNSKKIIDSDSNDNSNTSKDTSKVIIDTSTNEIKIYDNGVLSDVISTKDKLNYVGMNKILKYIIITLIITFISVIILKILKYKSIILTSLLYITILLLPIMLIFNDKISMYLDIITLMNVNYSNSKKEVVAKDEKIISYPSYGEKYGKLYIDDASDDVYFGDSPSILKDGIGQASFSSMPGEENATVLSAHNTGIFKKLHSLKKSDKVVIETVYGKFTYEVKTSKIVLEDNYDSIKKDYDLILYTCYPNKDIYGNKRIIVYLENIKSEWLGDTNEK